MQLKNHRSRCSVCCCFYFERNYDVLKSKRSCFLMNKYINFDKNETESTKENPTYALSLSFSSCKGCELKVNLLWWVRANLNLKSKFFVTFILFERHFLNIFFISMYSVMHKFSGYTYSKQPPKVFYKKDVLWHRCFPVNFPKSPKNTFSTEHLWTTASVYNFTYQKILLHTLFCLLLKSSKVFNVSLKILHGTVKL